MLRRLALTLPILSAAAVAGCGGTTGPSAPGTPAARLLPVPGSPSGKIVLSAQGAQRLGLRISAVRPVVAPVPPPPAPPAKRTSRGHARKTAPARRRPPAASARVPAAKVIVPFSAIVYAPDGRAYAFTSEAPLTFTEVAVTVDHITGTSAYLRSGPPAGAKVVTVGAEELFGVQSGVLDQT